MHIKQISKQMQIVITAKNTPQKGNRKTAMCLEALIPVIVFPLISKQKSIAWEVGSLRYLKEKGDEDDEDGVLLVLDRLFLGCFIYHSEAQVPRSPLRDIVLKYPLLTGFRNWSQSHIMFP